MAMPRRTDRPSKVIPQILGTKHPPLVRDSQALPAELCAQLARVYTTHNEDLYQLLAELHSPPARPMWPPFPRFAPVRCSCGSRSTSSAHTSSSTATQCNFSRVH
jgi:hypothetical protein